MKHNVKITAIILLMFIVTQFIGLYVVNYYFSNDLPFGMDPPQAQTNSDFGQILISIIISFVIAITLIFFLTKYNVDFFIKAWFFIVVVLSLGITLNALPIEFPYKLLIATLIAIPLGFIKIYKRNFLIHNGTELLIYPGIAAVFVPLLNFWTMIFLLLIISLYDMWAVWHSGIMQKMAKYQMDTLKIFSGFFVPYLNKKDRKKVKLIRQQVKEAKTKKQKDKLKNIGINVNVAILGGGDVIFPIITAGVMLKTFGLTSAIFVIAGATLGLAYLFFKSEKKKFYPAMPFITCGIFLGMIASWALL